MPDGAGRLIRAGELVGEVIRRTTFPVEAGKIREFATSLHDSNPLYRDGKVAIESGFSGIPAPPTFTAVAAHFHEGEDLFTILGLDGARVLHAGQEWKYHRPVIAGELVTCETTVDTVSSKVGRRGGELTVIVLRTEYVGREGEPLVTEAMTIIQVERPAARGSE